MTNNNQELEKVVAAELELHESRTLYADGRGHEITKEDRERVARGIVEHATSQAYAGMTTNQGTDPKIEELLKSLNALVLRVDATSGEAEWTFNEKIWSELRAALTTYGDYRAREVQAEFAFEYNEEAHGGEELGDNENNE